MKIQHKNDAGEWRRCVAHKENCPFDGGTREVPLYQARWTGGGDYHSHEDYVEAKTEYLKERSRKKAAARKANRHRQKALDETDNLSSKDRRAAQTLNNGVSNEDLDALYESFYAEKEAQRRLALVMYTESLQGREGLPDSEQFARIVKRAWGLRTPEKRRFKNWLAPRAFTAGKLSLQFLKWFWKEYDKTMSRAVKL